MRAVAGFSLTGLLPSSVHVLRDELERPVTRPGRQERLQLSVVLRLHHREAGAFAWHRVALLSHYGSFTKGGLYLSSTSSQAERVCDAQVEVC